MLAEFLAGGGIGAAISGVTGLVGGWLTKRENRLTAELNNSHELAMAAEDRKAAEFELNAQIQLADKQIDLAQTEGDIQREIIDSQSEASVAESEAEAFRLGMINASKPTGYSLVDKFRAMTRPAITWSLYVFVAVIFAVLHKEVGDLVVADTDLLIKLYVYLVQSVIYLFIMAVSWWFMSRGERSAEAVKSLMK